MEHAISFLFTLLGLELAETEGFKSGALITPSLVYRVPLNQSDSIIYDLNNVQLKIKDILNLPY